METQKIRIGNDIRLAVDLRQYIDSEYLLERKVYTPKDTAFENQDTNPYVNTNELYYLGLSSNSNSSSTSSSTGSFSPTGIPVGIRSVKAYLINTSKLEERLKVLQKKSRFISRFPIEPGLEYFRSTDYDICSCGYPTYRAYPHHHIVAPYHGYGIRPEWDSIYKPLPAFNDIEYRADVRATKDQHVVELSFPAHAQLYTGKYKLVIVAKLFAPGFNSLNLKTITVDVPDVIELVKTTEEGINTGILVNVGKVEDILDPTEEQTYSNHYVVDNTLYTS